jgi:hypothetical protein
MYPPGHHCLHLNKFQNSTKEKKCWPPPTDGIATCLECMEAEILAFSHQQVVFSTTIQKAVAAKKQKIRFPIFYSWLPLSD